MKNRFVAALLVIISLTSIGASGAFAMDRDVHAVLVTSEYGLIAGTVVGAATLPFTQDIRGLFLGSSIGLYLGLAVGIYYILDRSNPENPLRYQRPTFQDQQSLIDSRGTGLSVAQVRRTELQVQIPVLKF